MWFPSDSQSKNSIPTSLEVPSIFAGMNIQKVTVCDWEIESKGQESRGWLMRVHAPFHYSLEETAGLETSKFEISG